MHGGAEAVTITIWLQPLIPKPCYNQNSLKKKNKTTLSHLQFSYIDNITF